MAQIIKRTLAQQIYEILREDIIRHRIAGGSKITLKELQERFEVSSTPIREALSRLSHEKLVSQISNVSAKVLDVEPQDIIELHQLISCVESYALRLGVKNGKKEEMLREMEESIEGELAAKTHLERNMYLEKFHAVAFKYCDNSQFRDIADLVSGQLALYRNLIYSLPYDQANIDTHQKIIDAVKEEDYFVIFQQVEINYMSAVEYILKSYNSTK